MESTQVKNYHPIVSQALSRPNNERKLRERNSFITIEILHK